MNRSEIRQRLGSVIVAGICGWCAALAVTLPMQLVGIYLRADGDPNGLQLSLARAALVWAVWTLGITAAGLFLASLPIVLFLKQRWLLSNRRRSIAIAAFGAWIPLLIKFEIWKPILPDHPMNYWLFSVYSLLFIVFGAVTAAIHLRLADPYQPFEADSPQLSVDVAHSTGVSTDAVGVNLKK